jgi:hypothetical protein
MDSLESGANVPSAAHNAFELIKVAYENGDRPFHGEAAVLVLIQRRGDQ